MSTNAYLLIYAGILAFHFGYAAFLLRSGKDSLAKGGAKGGPKGAAGKRVHPVGILGVLLVINSLGATVALRPNARVWAWSMLIFQLGLATYELRGLSRARHRVAFLINHCIWAGLICVWLLTLKE